MYKLSPQDKKEALSSLQEKILPVRKINCKYCGEPGHTSITCWKKPRRGPMRESFKKKTKRERTRDLWYVKNPPDQHGYWDCYLRISPYCFIRMTYWTVIQEHVKPKKKYPELKYDLDNIRPACEPCNSLKSGSTLEELVETYPHLSIYIVDTA